MTDRPGKVKVTFKKLFSREDLAKYSIDEMTDILNKEIHTDDYAYNEVVKTFYKSNQIALNIDQLLYKCPRCGAEFEMTSTNTSLRCKKCGNKVEMDNYYTLKAKDNSITLKNPKVWFDYQREEVKKEIQNENFFFEEEVKIGFLPKYKYLKHLATSIIEGNGTLRVDHQGIHFRGYRNNKEFNFDLELSETPTYGMCTDATRFYTFLKGGEFIEFYPSRNSVIKWLLVTEELHRMHGGALAKL